MNRKRSLGILKATVLLLFAAAGTTFAAEIIYVDADATGLNDGSSWGDAYNFLQDALAAASSGNEIWVAQGVYKPDRGGDTMAGSRWESFRLKEGVGVYGGFPSGGAPRENRDPHKFETILSGDLKGNDADVNDLGKLLDHPTRTDNSYHVVAGFGQTSLLDGFTISGGNHDTRDWDGFLDGSGGGMVTTMAPTVLNCVFRHNSAGAGGGVSNRGGSPTFKNCVFEQNWAAYGAGMFNEFTVAHIVNCAFVENEASGGAGMYNSRHARPTIEACTFIGNLASGGYGSGMNNSYESEPIVDNCLFAGNFGTGMYNLYNSGLVLNCVFSGNSGQGSSIRNFGDPRFVNCTFVGNGGGISVDASNPTLTGCLIAGNSSSYSGGGISDYDDGYVLDPTLSNCTLAFNTAASDGGGVYSYDTIELWNCILWGNTDRDGEGQTSQISSWTAIVGWSCVQSWTGHISGSHFYTIGDNPLFVRGTGGVWTGDSIYDSNKYQVTLTDASANWRDGELVGRALNPDTTQPLQFIIVGNSANTISIWANWDTINNGVSRISSGSTYHIYDYHLQRDSPCINAGNPNYIPGPNETDMDGELRVMLGRVDMGADEFNPFTTEFVVVRKERVERTIFEYECEVVLENISSFAVKNVSLGMAKASENMTILEPNVTFGDTQIGRGESAKSVDTCTFRVDRAEAIDPAGIIWRVTAELADTGAKIEHTLASMPPVGPPETRFEYLAGLAEQWLWVGTPGGIEEDTIPDGTVNLADFAEFAAKWRGSEK